MKKILFILLIISNFLDAQSSFKDAEHEFSPACNNGKSIIMARYWFHMNAIDTVWKTYYFDSTGKNYTPTGAVTLGFCFKPDTGSLAMFQRIIDTLSSINSKEAINNQKNDTIIKRLDSLNAKTYFDSSWYKNLRNIEINLKDSLRTFRYSYIDTTNARLLNLVNKTYFDSSWYAILRKIQVNIADSLRTFNYKYDSINIVRNDTIISRLSGLVDTTMKNTTNYFQVQDCNGSNVGSPQKVVKSIVLNKVLASICNASDLKDTTINPIIRLMQKNIADSLRIFRFQYSYFDSLEIRLDSLLAKTTFDSSWYSVLRDIRTNVKDSLRTFKYSYIDTTNSRLAQLLLKQFADTSINPTLRTLQKNVADSLRTFNYSYQIANNVQNDTIIAKLAQIANKTSVDSTLINSSTKYQVKDCNDSAIGTPQTALKVVVLNKMSATICNLGALADSIASASKVDTSANALIRTNNKQNDTLIKRLDSLLSKQSTAIVSKPLARNISGTIYTTLTNCEHLSLGCCWTGTVSIQDAYSNTITLTNGEGFNFEAFKGRMTEITINATSATGAIVTGVCQ